MTGEMSREEVTRENFPLYFAAADTVEGATVEPFDQYQGPYIHVPGKGRFFLSGDYNAQWYSEQTDSLSEEFSGPGVARKIDGKWVEYPLQIGVQCFVDLIERDGR
jgi:hypothetical protein